MQQQRALRVARRTLTVLGIIMGAYVTAGLIWRTHGGV